MKDPNRPIWAPPGGQSEALFVHRVVQAIGNLPPKAQLDSIQERSFKRPLSRLPGLSITPVESSLRLTRILDPATNPAAYSQTFRDASVAVLWRCNSFALQRTIAFSRPHPDGGLEDRRTITLTSLPHQSPQFPLREYAVYEGQIVGSALAGLLDDLHFTPHLPNFSVFDDLYPERVKLGSEPASGAAVAERFVHVPARALEICPDLAYLPEIIAAHQGGPGVNPEIGGQRW